MKVRTFRRWAAGLAGSAMALGSLVYGAGAAMAAPVPSGFASRGISALSASQWWVLGAVPGCTHGCAAIATTSNGGASFTLVSRQPSASAVPQGATTLRMVTSSVGWLLAPSGALGHQVFRTFNGGATWSPVALAHKVTRLDVGAGRVWLTSVDGSTLGVWTSPATGSVVFARPLTATVTAPAGTPVLVAQSNGSALVLAAESGYVHLKEWRVVPTSFATLVSPYWCATDLGVDQVSASAGTTWISCPQGTSDFYGYSAGAGVGLWHGSPAVVAGSPREAVGGIDAADGIVGVQGLGKLYRVTTSGTHTAAVVPALGGANVDFSFIGFTNALDGFAIGESGALLHTTDSGLHWALVAV